MKIQRFQVRTSNCVLFFFFLLLLTGYQLQAQEIQIMVPNQYDGRTDSKQLQYDESFYIYKAPISPLIQLKDYKRYQRKYDLPDSVQIILPDMPNAIDTTLLIGFLRAKVTSPGHLVLLLATNYKTEEVTFYIDSNLDGNYRNDGRPFMILAGTPSINVALTPFDEIPLNLSLRVPKKLSLEEQRAAVIKELKRGNKKKVYNKLSIGAFAGIGTGGLKYGYDNIDIAFPAWYNVRFSEKALGLNLNYEAVKFRVGLNAVFTNHFYYTSYLNIRFSEPRGIRTGVLTERNIDIHSSNRLKVGASAAYKIRLSQYSDVQPFVSFGQLFYLSDNYFLDSRPNKEVSYSLSPNSFYELGVRFDFTIGHERSLFLDLMSNHLQWKPDNFLDGINFTNLTIKHQTWKINVGYKIAL